MNVILKLEVISPLFLGGANLEPELRPASVRGMLRFWMRAILGGIIGDENLRMLHTLESQIFGDTDHVSSVDVHLSQHCFTRSKQDLLPHKSNKAAVPTCSVNVGTTFSLTLALKPCVSQENLELATWSTLLWIMLGGIGKRSRRGAGSIRLQDFDVPQKISDDLKNCLNEAKVIATDRKRLEEQIRNICSKAFDIYKKYASKNSALPRGLGNGSQKLPSFSILLPSTRILVWSPKKASEKDYNTILACLMNEMHKLKEKNSLDFANSFGGIQPRRSSPLFVTVHKLQEGLVLVLTYLKAEITKGKNGKPEYVNNWLDELIKSGQAVECRMEYK